MLMQIMLVKFTLYVTDKFPKIQNFHRFISWENPVKFLKKCPQKANDFHPVPTASTAGPCPTIIDLLLRFYNNVQTEWQLCRP